jgi:hypothetical protein
MEVFADAQAFAARAKDAKEYLQHGVAVNSVDEFTVHDPTDAAFIVTNRTLLFVHEMGETLLRAPQTLVCWCHGIVDDTADPLFASPQSITRSSTC